MTTISFLTGLPLPPSVIMAPIVEMPLPMSYEQFRKDHPLSKPDVKSSESLRIKLSWPQYDFVTSPAKFPAMVAGYGAGKTEAADRKSVV